MNNQSLEEMIREVLERYYISPKEASEVLGFKYLDTQLEFLDATRPNSRGIFENIRERKGLLLPGPNKDLNFKKILDLDKYQHPRLNSWVNLVGTKDSCAYG